jgi:predicted AlkP superfamily pyrophosphatase or phosphodiesterase
MGDNSPRAGVGAGPACGAGRRTAVINVVGLTPRHIGPHTPAIAAFAQAGRTLSIRPSLPAVTCTAQSTYLTGAPPSVHGAVANGWYDRSLAEIHFWKQSNHLIGGEKLWETARKAVPGFTCAQLFWWYNMYSSVDYSITPRPLYPADGRKFFDIYAEPFSIRTEIKEALGDFPFPAFWGPRAGIASSEWIARSAQWTEEHHQPSLSLIYLPHLDYNLQRLGPDDPKLADDLRAVDRCVGQLLAFFAERSVEVVLLSEYGITAVNRAIPLNRVLRERGWLRIKDELGLEMLDPGASRAFAVVDHQLAHIYINDPSLRGAVRGALENTPGVVRVLDRADQAAAGLDHPRSGDLVAISDEHSWFSYYHWLDDRLAPDFARCVDIHRKAGYDPVELFIDPRLRAPRLRVAAKLLRKKLGFRVLMDLIPLDASLVRGSHGCIPADPRDWPVLIGRSSLLPADRGPIEPTAVKQALLEVCLRG